jgi:hypothetical protein
MQNGRWLHRTIAGLERTRPRTLHGWRLSWHGLTPPGGRCTDDGTHEFAMWFLPADGYHDDRKRGYLELRDHLTKLLVSCRSEPLPRSASRP